MPNHPMWLTNEAIVGSEKHNPRLAFVFVLGRDSDDDCACIGVLRHTSCVDAIFEVRNVVVHVCDAYLHLSLTYSHTIWYTLTTPM